MLAHNVPLLELFRSDRRALEMERQSLMESPSRKAQLSSSKDPYSALGSQRVALEREPFLCLGRVGDPIAYTHFYKMRLSRQGGIVPACMATQTSLEVMGAKQLNTLVPGTQVVAMWSPHMPFAIILGVVPDFMLSPLDAMGDRVVQGSRVGLNIDSYQNFPFDLVMAGGIIDWSAGRANDQIHSGEWGAVTDTGLMFFMDPFMMMMRVDEETGIFGFYDDQMLRVSGHNLELRSSGYERTDDDDEWEFNLVEECVPGYLWEGRGAFNRPRTIYRTYTTEDVQTSVPHYAETEPFDDHQQPIRRYRKFMGYLGQGYKRTLFILPEEGSPDRNEEIPNLLKITDNIRFPGVAEEQWGLDGFISQRSAKGILLSKRILIPMPKRVKLEEDTSGDTAATYKQDGVWGSPAAPDHKISDIAYPPCEPTNLLQAAAFLDLYAHVFNWRGLHPFHYHDKDFYMPQDDDYWFSPGMIRGNPPFVDCRSPSDGMRAPLPFLFTVDERYGQIMYFPNNSYLALLDDGGVVLGDGYGSEIRMTAGNIYNTCANDIYELPGKNYACWAGHDFVARGNWNVHLVANRCNAFIKAENKVLVMGGNDKCGGVLIESKSPVTQFETETPPNIPAKCSIAQSGGFRNSISATCDCTGYPPQFNLKEVYRICVASGGAIGVATGNIISASGTDSAFGVVLGGVIAVGGKGCLAFFSSLGDPFVVGQEWTLSVTTDANDLNDETIAGVLLRAKESTVYTYAANIENLLSHDGIGGLMIYNAGRNGQFFQHGQNIIRHIESHADDIFWTTTAPSYIIIFESTAALKDATYYFGPVCTYLITCIEGNYDQPLNAARVSVVASCGDGDDSVVVAVPPTLTAIGNRGFRWTPLAANIFPGDSWSYLLKQEFDPCVNHWDKKTASLCQKICTDDMHITGCLTVTEEIATKKSVVAKEFLLLSPADESTIDTKTTVCKKIKDDHYAWAFSARADLTVIKDNTKVTKMEFFFPSSYQNCTEPPWKIFETRWQQLDRNQGAAGVFWSEHYVTGADASCFVTANFQPWPGKYSWSIWQTHFKEDVNLFQLSSNLLIDRGVPYEPPVAYNPPVGSPFDGQWRIIENTC